MDFDKVVRDINGLGLNLYDFALCTDEGIFAHKFQPCNACNDSYSVAKAFIMTAIGLLEDDGLLRVEDKIYPYFEQDFPLDADEKWREVTIENALTHTIGFDKGFLDIDAEDARAYPTDDYLSIVLSHKLALKPGEKYVYSDAAFYLLSRLISRVAGKNADELLRERIIRPLRFREIAWSRCPQGYPMGATGLYAGASDIVKLGWLYLNGGVYDGKRLLSKSWVDQALAKQYEFRKLSPRGLTGKGGMFGQCLAFSQKARFAVAWHAYADKEHRAGLIEYLDGLIK